MISNHVIKQIFAVARVEEVINDFIFLKKSGSNYRGLSPFSNERTPSLIVSPSKQIWKDFSSGKGGNVISFIMEHENIGYVEALFFLAKKYDIKIFDNYYYNNKKNDEIESNYLIQDYAKEFFVKNFFKEKDGLFARNYIISRGLKIEIIKKFEIGYANDNFTQSALNKGFNINYLIKSGLTTVNHKDFFINRIIFPIYSISGRVLGFGGRIIQNNFKPKYINSTESEIFKKKNIIYGLYQSKNFILKNDFCYLVEGYIDVISLYQIGLKNVVATLGTYITYDQIRFIKRFTSNIILLYDGDNAGIKAALRAIDIILEQDMNVHILLFPNEEDPDRFVNNNNNNLEKILCFIKTNTLNFIQFKIKNLLKNHNSLINKELVIKSVINSIAKIPNIIRKEIYIKEASKLLNLDENIIKKYVLNNNCVVKKQYYKKNSSKTLDTLLIVEKEIIKIIINYGEEKYKNTTIIQLIINYFNYNNFHFCYDLYEKIFYYLQLGLRNNNYKFIYNKLLMNNNIKRIIYNIYDLNDNLNIEYLHSTLLRHKSLFISKIINEYIHKIKNGNENNFLIKKIMKLTYLKNKINLKLNYLI
ncbi:MAG: DNA primase [Candidatus Bostrichicola ureolyticus]|nr:MAG: DNA primase [Candidatus Bostrichicola ureolyticus]